MSRTEQHESNGGSELTSKAEEIIDEKVTRCQLHRIYIYCDKYKY